MSTTPLPAASATPVASNFPAATPAAKPTQNVFTLGLVVAPSTLDPANAADESALLITRHLYEGLTAFEPGTTRPVSALAERWEVSADGLVWTFHLRGGVRFSDGEPFDADAVRLNFERWYRGTPPGNYAFWQALFGGFAGQAGEDGTPLSLLAEARAASPQVLEVRLVRPDGSLPNTLALPTFAFVSPRALRSGDVPGALDDASAGTGRFILADWPQPGLVHLRRNPDYWDAAAAGAGPDELVFKIIPDDTQRLLALQTGEIEGMAHLNPRDYAVGSDSSSVARVEFDPALNVLYLGFNQAHAPWNVLECRLAVAYALDAERYVRDYFPGDAEVGEGMQPPATWGFSTASARVYDPGQAQSHWQACQAGGATVPVSVTLYVPPIERLYLPDHAGLGAAVRADLEMLGLTVALATPDWQSEWLPAVYSGEADLFLLGAVGLNGDPDSFLCPLFCGDDRRFNSTPRGEPLPPDAELAALLRHARAIADPADREALYRQAHQRIFDTVPAIPLAYRNSAWAYRREVRGSVPSPIESLFFYLTRDP